MVTLDWNMLININLKCVDLKSDKLKRCSLYIHIKIRGLPKRPLMRKNNIVT
jgi:hypothetical protein